MERKDFVKIIQIKAIFFYVLIDFHGEETTIFSAQFFFFAQFMQFIGKF